MSHRILSLACGGAALLAFGCDVEPSSAMSYDVVAHVEVSALKSSPWAKTMLEGGNIKFNADGASASACEKLVKQAKAITVGVGNDRMELYVEGKLKAADRDACIDEVEGQITKKGKDAIKTVELSDSLMAVSIGPAPLPDPSRDRLADLRDADPSPKSDQPMWIIVDKAPKDEEVKYIEGWANPAKGLDAHVHVEFKDDAAASKAHAEAALGLTALRMSGEMSGLAKAIKLAAAGDTITADVHASQKQMKTLMNDGDSKKNSSPKKEKSGFSFSIESK